MGTKNRSDTNLDDFVVSDETKIKWSRNLKAEVAAKQNC